MRVALCLLLLSLLTAQCKKTDPGADVAARKSLDVKGPSAGLDVSPSGLSKPQPDALGDAEQSLDTVLAISLKDPADAATAPANEDVKTAPDSMNQAQDATPAPADAAPADLLPDVPATAKPLNLPPPADPASPQIIFDRFQALVKEAEISEAIRLLEEWLKVAPKDSINRQNLARTYIQLGQFEPAIPHLAQLTTDKPQDGPLWAHYARALAKLERYSQANDAFRKAYDINTDDIDLVLDFSRSLGKSGRYSEASTILETGLKLNVRKDELLAEWAAILALAGQYPKALEIYQQVQGLKPTLENAITLAQLAHKFQKCDDVVAALTPFEAKFTTDVPYLLLSDCLSQRSEFPAAAIWLQKATTKIPGCVECELALGDALAMQKLFSQADPHYRKVLELKPADYRGHLQLGKSLGLQGKHIEAAEALAKANDRNPNFPEILEAYGNELALSSQAPLAWKVWSQLKELDAEAALRLKTLLEK